MRWEPEFPDASVAFTLRMVASVRNAGDGPVVGSAVQVGTSESLIRSFLILRDVGSRRASTGSILDASSGQDSNIC